VSEGHARLGPSNKRWPVCPGSVREEANYPDIPGAAAIDGTGSHLLLELCLQNNVQAHAYDQQIIGANHSDNPNGWLVAPDRIERVQMALDYIKRRVNELKSMFPGCNVMVESESTSDPGGAFGRDDWWGTCDITITARHPMTGDIYFIEVADYKDGRGYVSEKNNTQNISYLFGKIRSHIASGPDKVRPFNPANIGGIRMTIIQPKTNPVVRYQCSTRQEDNVSSLTVIEAAEKLAHAAHLTDDDNAPVVPGKHCQWCKANPKRGGHCTAILDKSLQVVEKMNKSNLNLIDTFKTAVADIKSLTESQLSEIADTEEGVQAIFDKVKSEIKERIKQGIDVPGYAMVPGRGSRVWNEGEDEIVKKLKSRRLKLVDIYPKKLISPAQLMKLEKLTESQKKRISEDLISFKDGNLTLKKVSHKKEEKVVVQSPTDDVQSQVQLMFADVPKPVTEEVSFF